MRGAGVLLVAGAIAGWCATAQAIEGVNFAGPVGGTDIRVAQYPPPGLWSGVTLLHAQGYDFVDGNGNRNPRIPTAHIVGNVAGPFLAYIPNLDVFGGSLGFLAAVPLAQECGHLLLGSPYHCVTAAGDPYLEAGWSRFFGRVRRSADPNAYPIREGLAIAIGLGVVAPVGQYNTLQMQRQGVTIGNNLLVVAPSIAVTYTTPPLIADGTEFSAKVYYNTYRKNPETQYQTGAVINTDFAITERFGRIQFGLAGFYAHQVEDDTLFGIRVGPDGRRARMLNIGAVLGYDMPAQASLLKVKALVTAYKRNMPSGPGIAFTFVQKLY